MDSGGVFGDNSVGDGFPIENQDTYATGDGRIPYLVGTVSRKGAVKGKKKRKKKKI